ncbi:MAG: M15 family metallopeptidase [Methylocella sp.]
MFQLPYVTGPLKAPPTLNDDPGRIRNEAFFTKMYGNCEKGEVVPRMRAVQWMPSYQGGIVMVTTVNGVADKLEAVVRDLEKLHSTLMKDLVPSGGTYNCRHIAGTQRRSMHAYGAALDINTKYSDYWCWPMPKHGLIQYRNKIPFEIVDAFERHGFIWGGKWYHFDTMHFEYRPELMPTRLIEAPLRPKAIPDYADRSASFRSRQSN